MTVQQWELGFVVVGCAVATLSGYGVIGGLVVLSIALLT